MAGCAALVLAGGSGSRFGGDIPKQYLTLAGRAVLRRAAEAFAGHEAVDYVRVVIRAEDRDLYDAAFAGLDILPPAIGGPSRQDSARLGLESLKALAPKHVLIHDGARPFVAPELVDRMIVALADAPAAVPALPVSDTLKRAQPDRPMVAATVDRSLLWRAQTPQAFRYDDIAAAHVAAAGAALTDDAMVAEHAGLSVALVMGSEENVKITTRDDLERAERALDASLAITRVGSGFDVHRFCSGDHVMLCGVRIPHDFGLEGHSDADAGLHALTDAILGAIGEGDIGVHFPPTDPQWRAAPSDIFLRHAGKLAVAKGGEIVNVDVTLVCERPKIGPHRDAMRARIATILCLPIAAVGVKATTTEGLGFTGRGEGIAAQAIAAVRLPRS